MSNPEGPKAPWERVPIEKGCAAPTGTATDSLEESCMVNSNVFQLPVSRHKQVHRLLVTKYLTQQPDPRPALARAAVERFWLNQMKEPGGAQS
jgi:hypothetical protein